jgi:hypothetical protein
VFILEQGNSYNLLFLLLRGPVFTQGYGTLVYAGLGLAKGRESVLNRLEDRGQHKKRRLSCNGGDRIY